MHVETEKEVDGRWIAEVRELPGALAYGDTESDAMRHVSVLALRIMASQQPPNAM